MSSQNISIENSGDPTSRYDSPAALAADDSLSVEQRISLLKAWERNARQLQVATGEGLEANPSTDADEGVNLHEIALALKKLGHEGNEESAQSDVSGSSVD